MELVPAGIEKTLLENRRTYVHSGKSEGLLVINFFVINNLLKFEVFVATLIPLFLKCSPGHRRAAFPRVTERHLQSWATEMVSSNHFFSLFAVLYCNNNLYHEFHHSISQRFKFVF